MLMYMSIAIFRIVQNIAEILLTERVSEWLLLNANSAIFQLYYGENKLIFTVRDDDVLPTEGWVIK